MGQAVPSIPRWLLAPPADKLGCLLPAAARGPWHLVSDAALTRSPSIWEGTRPRRIHLAQPRSSSPGWKRNREDQAGSPPSWHFGAYRDAAAPMGACVPLGMGTRAPIPAVPGHGAQPQP